VGARHFHATVAELLAHLPGPKGERFAAAYDRDEVTVELYAPRGTDPQQPHTRNEVYVVVQGRGEFCCDGDRHPVGAGDVLLVLPGVAHRFERFSDDFAAWGIFWPQR
jgi:mannose-6-phosphate isomerase-like protein (cupin superfamily)